MNDTEAKLQRVREAQIKENTRVRGRAPMKFKIITHFSKDNIGGDYEDIEIVMLPSKVVEGITGPTEVTVAEFGDQYHDKGEEKVGAFIQGVDWFRKTLGYDPVEVEEVEIDDREGWL